MAACTTDSAGVLQVSDGNTVTVTYIDADDGLGGTNVVVTETATVECLVPVFSLVSNTELVAPGGFVTVDVSVSSSTGVLVHRYLRTWLGVIPDGTCV